VAIAYPYPVTKSSGISAATSHMPWDTCSHVHGTTRTDIEGSCVCLCKGMLMKWHAAGLSHWVLKHNATTRWILTAASAMTGGC
jgi:hypothetical protein